MSDTEKKEYVGIAKLFDSNQLKAYFINYLHFIVIVEIIIFIASCVGYLKAGGTSFSWKFYFSVAFTVPIVITFLLGLFILAFNRYLFGKNPGDPLDASASTGAIARKSPAITWNTFLNFSRSIPFLFVLFLLIAGSIILYQTDTIFLFVANAGEKVIRYFFICAGVTLGAAIIVGVVWLVVNYKLRKKQMDQQYQYKNEVMQRLGMLIMDDNTVIDRQGNVISLEPAKILQKPASIQEDLQLLPNSKNKAPIGITE
jgi:hypothetical protein